MMTGYQNDQNFGIGKFLSAYIGFCQGTTLLIDSVSSSASIRSFLHRRVDTLWIGSSAWIRSGLDLLRGYALPFVFDDHPHNASSL